MFYRVTVLILTLFPVFLAKGEPATSKPSWAGKRPVVVSCYGHEQAFRLACQKAKEKLSSDCKPPVQVISVKQNATAEEVAGVVKDNKLPDGTWVVSLGHGIRQQLGDPNDKFLEDRENRPSVHHLVTGRSNDTVDLFRRKGDEGIAFQKGVVSTDIVKQSYAVNPKLSHWFMSCVSGGICETGDSWCVGTSCQKTETTPALSSDNYIDPSTKELLNLYCDKDKFDKVDKLGKQDGVLSPEELKEHLCKVYPPYFEIDIAKEKGPDAEKDFAISKDSMKLVLKYALDPKGKEKLDGWFAKDKAAGEVLNDFSKANSEYEKRKESMPAEEKAKFKERYLASKLSKEDEAALDAFKKAAFHLSLHQHRRPDGAFEFIKRGERGAPDTVSWDTLLPKGLQEIQGLYPRGTDLISQMTFEEKEPSSDANKGQMVYLRANLPHPGKGCIYFQGEDGSSGIAHEWAAKSFTPSLTKFSLQFQPGTRIEEKPIPRGTTPPSKEPIEKPNPKPYHR